MQACTLALPPWHQAAPAVSFTSPTAPLAVAPLPSCLTQQVPLSEEEQAAAAAKPDRMAIGVEGGFDVDAKKYKIETDWVSLR